MSSSPPRHRRNRFWPAPLPPYRVTGAPPFHEHRTSKAPLIPLYLGMTVLTAVVVLLLIFVLVLRHARDTEQQRFEERFRADMCALLDQFPPSPVLDGPRRTYRCGPGTPLEQLPPAVRQQFGGVPASPASRAPVASPPTTAPATAQAPAAPAVPLGGAQGAPATPTQIPVGTRAPGMPAPTTSPLDPVLCGLLPNLCHLPPL